MSKYQELLSQADHLRNERNDFERRALHKAGELIEALCTYLECTKDKIALVPLAPNDSTEARAPLNTVLTAEGLRFAFKVNLGDLNIGYMATIEPYGSRLVVNGRDGASIDVGLNAGVQQWCERVEAFLLKRMDDSIGGALAAKLAGPG